MKEKLLVSFSGGETSGYMLQWIKKHWSEKYDIKYVFANTGEENEETLLFTKKCQEYFDIDLIWVEAVFHKEKGKGTTHRVVDFQSAERSNKLFMEMAAVYGIPNQMFPHCNRELKLAPIKSYLRSIGWKKYQTAIGIRNDEIDRVNSNKEKYRLLYPLVTNQPMTKPKINFWWSQQPFRLNLKGYQGNCKTCWKKGDNKLYQIAKENRDFFNSFKEVEDTYANFIPDGRSFTNEKITFFRRGRSVDQILKEAENFNGVVRDDSAEMNYQTSILDYDESESCDIYSMCGDD